MNKYNALVVYAKPYTKEQKLSCNLVNNALKKAGIKFELCERTQLDKNKFDKKEMVITVGGDGTFLRAAQFINGNTPIIGVNSDVHSKEGFYMGCSRSDFEKKLDSILKDNFKIKKLLRVESKINNNEINELALNEFYIGASKAYMTSRYKIKVNNISESQRSSGVIAATPSGSRAWAKAVMAKPISLDFKGFLFVVREPFEHNIFGNYKLRKGVINQGSKLAVKSEMGDGVLVADSVGSEHHIKYGDKVEIMVSKNSLSVIEV